MAQFQYYSGGVWVAENQYIRLTYLDEVYFPQTIHVTVANPDNNRESVYYNTPYMRVRIVETTTNRILFYGKIEKVKPDYDAEYGQVLIIIARDNFNELLRRTIDTNYTGFVRRSVLTQQIVSDYSYTGNINTADADKFDITDIAEAANVINSSFDGSGKNVLRSIIDLAQEDPWDATPTGFGYEFYLDNMFSGNNPVPRMHFFRRNTRPSTTPSTHGLTVRFRAPAETDQTRQMLSDYNFPRQSMEMTTTVRIEYVDQNKALQSISVILMNISNVVGGFTVGNTITGGLSGTTAVVQYIGASFLILSAWSGLFTIGETVADGGNTAVVVSLPRQTIEQDIQVVIRGYDVQRLAEARDRAAHILFNESDITVRGNFKIVRYPYVRFTGAHVGAGSATTLNDPAGDFLNKAIRVGDVVTNTTNSISGTITSMTATTLVVAGGGMSWDDGDAYEVYVIVRAGHRIRVRNDTVPFSGGTLNNDMVITKIQYDEGPGIQMAEIEVAAPARVNIAESQLNRMEKEAETGLWQSVGAAGGIPIASKYANIDWVFTTPAWNQVGWAGGTITFSDGTTQTINAVGSPYTFPDANSRYFYVISGNATLQNSNLFSDVVGLDNTLIAIGKRGDSASGTAQIVSLNQGSPTIVAGVLLANQLSAITANMGYLTAGTIEIPTGAAFRAPAAGFTGFQLTGNQIAGYNAGVRQVYIQSSDGRMYAGAGAVIIDATGVHFDGSLNSAAQFEAAGYRDVYVYNEGTGAFVITTTGAGTVITDLDLYDFTEIAFKAVNSLIFNIGNQPATLQFDVGAAGIVRPFASGAALGGSGNYWGSGYIDTLYTQNIYRRSGAGGDIGTATVYFSTIYLGQSYNSITGSGGDMIFRVKNTAGNGDISAVFIEDGDNPVFYLPAITTLKFGTHSAVVAETVTGYITITDAVGNSRKLAVVS